MSQVDQKIQRVQSMECYQECYNLEETMKRGSFPGVSSHCLDEWLNMVGHAR